MCGLFGVRSHERDVARLTYFGLFALQHRGQESAGIAVSDEGRLTALRDMGLVTQVFDEQKLRGLRGDLAIGHTRYSTTGSSQWWNAQPLVQHGSARTIALGHNGNVTNAAELREELGELGHRPATTADTEVIAALIANDPAPLADAVANTMRKLDGAFSVVALSEGKLIAFRDPRGMRPLCLGRLDRDWVVASETCALDLVGAELEREIRPGELMVIDERVEARQVVPQDKGGALCIFEFFYLARPDSKLQGIEVHAARVRMGKRLAEESPAEADLVMPIPDSGTPAAIGFSRASNIPFSEGLIKNRYVGRTFIQPDQAGRGGRQARRRRGRLDRPGQHDAADRPDALRLRSGRSARPDLVATCGLTVLLRDRLRGPGRADRREQDGRRSAGIHRRDLAGLHLARRAAGVDTPSGVTVLPRLPHAGLPNGNPARGGEAAIRNPGEGASVDLT